MDGIQDKWPSQILDDAFNGAKEYHVDIFPLDIDGDACFYSSRFGTIPKSRVYLGAILQHVRIEGHGSPRDVE